MRIDLLPGQREGVQSRQVQDTQRVLPHGGDEGPPVCINCVDPACVTSCPTEALVKNNVTGLVTLDDDACNNCLACIEACKYGSIRLTPDDVIIKCDTCGGDPECVKICETKAITFADRKPQTLTQARKGVAKWAEVKKTEEVLA